MSRNPIHEVLSTPELVALVLIHLPPHDLLLRAPLVSPTFNCTILSTPSLQEALFFRPSPFHHPGPLTLNPFLKTAFPTHFQALRRYHGSPEIRDSPWGRNPVAFRRKEASWRKMLLWSGGEQETVEMVKVTSMVQQMSGIYGRTGFLKGERGVTMGMVWDLTRSACETEDKGQFLMKWRIDVFGKEENQCIDRPLTNGQRRSVSLFGRMRGVLGGRRIPVETRYVNLGNRVDVEDEDVLEISLSTYTTCEGREMNSPAPKRLGEEFRSEACEKVEIEYGESIRIPGSIVFGNSTAVFRAQASRRRNLLDIFDRRP